MVLANLTRLDNADGIWALKDDNGAFEMTIDAERINFGQFLNNMYAGMSIVPEAYSEAGYAEFWGRSDIHLHSIALTLLAGDEVVWSHENAAPVVGDNILKGDISINFATINYSDVTSIRFDLVLSARNQVKWVEMLPNVNQAARILVSPMYFSFESLGLWITWQQRLQFMSMYPSCFEDGYRTAVGKLTAQVGNIFDMAAILAETSEDAKDNTIRWILQVLTAYNVCSPTLDVSTPLEAANREVSGIIAQLKGGQVSLQEPAAYREEEYAATAEIVTNRNQYIG